MKHIITKFIILFILIVGVSCSVHKRHYSRGYFVSWNKNKHAKAPETASGTIAVNSKYTRGVVPRDEIESKVNSVQLHSPLLSEAVVFNKTAERKNISPAKNFQFEKNQARASKEHVHEPIQQILMPDDPKVPDEKPAMIAMIVSVAGFCLIGFVGSIIGLVLANKALKNIQAHPDKYGGKDLAEAARIISIIGLILGILLFIFAIIIFAAVLSAI